MFSDVKVNIFARFVEVCECSSVVQFMSVINSSEVSAVFFFSSFFKEGEGTKERKKGNPTVFMDIVIGGKPAGRITMLVSGSSSHMCK